MHVIRLQLGFCRLISYLPKVDSLALDSFGSHYCLSAEWDLWLLEIQPLHTICRNKINLRENCLPTYLTIRILVGKKTSIYCQKVFIDFYTKALKHSINLYIDY